MRHCRLNQEWLVDVNAGKTQLVLFDWSHNSGKIIFHDAAIAFLFYIGLEKIRALIHYIKFHSPKVALYLYKSTTTAKC